jgi:arylsulfatase A-like enzyme
MARPNILFIFTDQQARGAMGASGNAELHTPHMDALARAGVRFHNSYCTSPVCSPARASLVTGMMPHTTGVDVNDLHIRPELLFDLENDPGETRNLAAHPPCAGELHRHRGLLAHWIANTNDDFVPSPP